MQIPHYCSTLMLILQRVPHLILTAASTMLLWNCQGWLLWIYSEVSNQTTQVQWITGVVMRVRFVVTKTVPFAGVLGTRWYHGNVRTTAYWQSEATLVKNLCFTLIVYWSWPILIISYLTHQVIRAFQSWLAKNCAEEVVCMHARTCRCGCVCFLQSAKHWNISLYQCNWL